MTRHELIEYCMTYPGAYEDYPFGELQRTADVWTVMRHSDGKKGFAFIFERNGLCVNLKCEPMTADFLRRSYMGITAAYHMNKRHWNTVKIDSDVPRELLEELIDASYKLTRRAHKARESPRASSADN